MPLVLIRNKQSPEVGLATQFSFLGISLLQHLHTAFAVIVVSTFLRGAAVKPARGPGFEKESDPLR